MSTIIEHLQVCGDHKEKLTIKYQEKEWIGFVEEPTHSALVRIALSRISGDPSQYHIFMDMLKTIAGMDIVVNGIEGKRYHVELGVVSIYYFCLRIYSYLQFTWRRARYVCTV